VHDSSNFHTTNIESWKLNPFSGTPANWWFGKKCPIDATIFRLGKLATNVTR
jgi:hypothetical protein